MTADPTSIATAYFDAWRARDSAMLRDLLSDDATFSGPLGRAEGGDEMQRAIEGLFAITTDVIVRKMLADEDDVITWFDLHTSVAPPAAVANWSHIENGKIRRVRATFDPREIIAARPG